MEQIHRSEYLTQWLNLTESDRIIEASDTARLSNVIAEIEDAMRDLVQGDRIIVIGNNRIGVSKWIERNSEYAGHIVQARKTPDDDIGVSISEMRNELAKLDVEVKWFYPYPNNTVLKDIYTDTYMPKVGFNFGNTPDYDHERIQLMDQTDATDVLLEAGLMNEFFDSFMIVISRELSEEVKNLEYIHLSQNRNPEFCTRTEIYNDGNRTVFKRPLSDRATVFVKNIYNNEQVLSARYQNSNISFNKAYQSDRGGIELEYIEGETLSEYLDSLLEMGKIDSCIKSIREFFEDFFDNKAKDCFTKSEQFESIFGDVAEAEWHGMDHLDVDCIFDNVFYNASNDRYTVMDYEWTFDFEMPIEFIKYRCIHYYLSYRKMREELLGEQIWDVFGINGEQRELFADMERSFQNYVYSEERRNQVSAGEKDNWLLNDVFRKFKLYKTNSERVYDRKEVIRPLINSVGSALNESVVLESTRYKDEMYYVLEFDVPEGVREVKFCPSKMSGILNISKITNDEGHSLKFKAHNVERIKNHKYLCAREGAYVTIGTRNSKRVVIRYRFDLLISENEFLDVPPMDLEKLEQAQIKITLNSK